MPVLDLTHRQAPPALEIRASAADELLMSLCAFTAGGEQWAGYDVGPAWFKAVQMDASPDLCAAISAFSAGYQKIWAQLLSLVEETPQPREVPAFLAHLKATTARHLYLHLLGYYLAGSRGTTRPEIILEAANGDPGAKRTFLAASFPEDPDWQNVLRHLLSLGAEQAKQQVLDILAGWYREVFQKREATIMPILVRDAAAKRKLSRTVPVERLIELATNGVAYEPEAGIHRVVLIPTVVMRPWVVISEHQDTKIFCYPAAESLTAEDNAPPTQLLRLHQSLGDERRLRILRELAYRRLTLQEMAAFLGVAPSTMHHHLAALRAAGLVTLHPGTEKRYTLRRNALASVADLLHAYVYGDAEEDHGRSQGSS